MKKVLRISAILIALVMCFSLAACKDNSTTTNSPGNTPGTSNTNTPGTSTSPNTNTPNAPIETTTGGESGGTIDAIDPVGLILWPGDIITPPANGNFADSVNFTYELGVSVLDPQSPGSTFTACRVTFQMVYDRLTYYDINGVLQPELATRWETNDAQTWTFYLRDDVNFHNGDHFTAQDVLNTWQSSRNPGSLAWDNWRSIDHMNIINDYQIEIVLEAPYSDFAYNLSLPGGAIVNKRARDADPVTGAWIGTGAFRVTDFVSSQSIQLTRNDNYWGTAPLTRVVNFTYVPEMAARTVMQVNGESDVCMSVSSQDNDLFLQSPDHYLYAYAANSTHSLTFNLNHPITGDYNFRMAVACAINREECAMASSGIWAKPTQDGAFWGDSTPFRDTSIPRIPQDLDLAREYLAKSTYNGEVLQLITAPDTLTTSSQMLQEQLRVVGINVEVYTTDVATLVGMTQYGDQNFTLLHFVSPFELAPSSARVMLYPGMSANRASYNNPEVNDLLDRVISITDPVEQERMYHQIQQIVATEIPQLSIFEKVWTLITNNRVGGIITNPDMNHDFRGVFMLAD